MLSGSSPVFVLSNHTTFSQTQTGTTVPLKLLIHTHIANLKGQMPEIESWMKIR
jgi:hypothetical protein